MQDSSLLVKLSGVVWSGKTNITPQVLIDKVQMFLFPNTAKQVQEFVGLLGYWRASALHPCLWLLYNMYKRHIIWDKTDWHTEDLHQVKWRGKQVQVLGTLDTSKTDELTVYVTPYGFGWGLWQKVKGHSSLLNFGYSYGRGKKLVGKTIIYSLCCSSCHKSIHQRSTSQGCNWWRSLEEAPKEEIATWLHCRLKHTGKDYVDILDFPIKMSDVVACQNCLACSQS